MPPMAAGSPIKFSLGYSAESELQPTFGFSLTTCVNQRKIPLHTFISLAGVGGRPGCERLTKRRERIVCGVELRIARTISPLSQGGIR